ncbi:integrase domain-containing protein [Catenovulum agarivorans]|uniref:integrase domain-containing protein n=1 Tax=Catenovulum agarivorans TaxID=1172192 RepID=UPI000314423C|nr:integrase domain-containing protein [Catenovulum agarivorans]
MPKQVKPLTNTEISKAKAKDKEYNLSDGDGLSLRIKPNGSKLWLFNFISPESGKRSNLSFGLYPDVSLQAARQQRLEARALLASDICPKAHKELQKQETESYKRTTLVKVAESWMNLKKNQVTAHHAEDIWRSLDNHVFSKMGDTPIKSIQAKKVIDVLTPLANRNKLETVKRVCQRLNEVMVFAVNTGLIEHNCLAGIRAAFNNPDKKNMPALPPEELPEFMRALNIARIKLTTRCLIEWQLHTMTRPSEAAGARWDELNLDEKIWLIPAERMKKRRDHIIPLTEQTLAMVEFLKPITGTSPFLFPADRDHFKPASTQTANKAIERMGFKGRLVAHGMRSIASTVLNSHGFDFDVIEAALAHVDKNTVRRAYNRADYLERRRVLMAWWSEYIVKASTGHFTQSTERKALRAVNG